jgi:peptidoglycan/xylan/chitin deacetylase (PgdA/CDA1 family)
VKTSARRYIKLGVGGGLVFYATRYIRTFYLPKLGQVTFEPATAISESQYLLWRTTGRIASSLLVAFFPILFLSFDTTQAKYSAAEDLTEDGFAAAGLVFTHHLPRFDVEDPTVLFSASRVRVFGTALVLPSVLLGILYAAAHPGANIFGTVIHEVKTHKNLLALTFDDGPNPATTPQILAILKENKIKATFFVIGENARLYPALLKQIHQSGHEIEVHSRTHSPRLVFRGRKTIREDLANTIGVIYEHTQSEPNYFRPPWGRRTPWMLGEAEKLHLKTVTWSIDSRDWLCSSGKTVIKRVERRLTPGAIVLLHDGRGQRHPEMKSCIEALPKIIELGKDKGYSFVTLDELVRLPADQMADQALSQVTSSSKRPA